MKSPAFEMYQNKGKMFFFLLLVVNVLTRTQKLVSVARVVISPRRAVSK